MKTFNLKKRANARLTAKAHEQQCPVRPQEWTREETKAAEKKAGWGAGRIWLNRDENDGRDYIL